MHWYIFFLLQLDWLKRQLLPPLSTVSSSHARGKATCVGDNYLYCFRGSFMLFTQPIWLWPKQITDIHMNGFASTSWRVVIPTGKQEQATGLITFSAWILAIGGCTDAQASRVMMAHLPSTHFGKLPGEANKLNQLQGRWRSQKWIHARSALRFSYIVLN